VKEESLRCFTVVCRGCISLFSKEEKVLLLQAKMGRNKASALRELEDFLNVGDEKSKEEKFLSKES